MSDSAGASPRDGAADDADWFRVAVETMIDCLGIYRAVRDEAGQILDFRCAYVNDSACRSSQRSREEQVGGGLCEILQGHRESGLFDEYCQVVRTGAPLTMEVLSYTDVHGRQVLQRATDIRVAPLGDGFVAAWRDVTARKRGEERLRFLAESSALLAESLDYGRTVEVVARQCIPLLGEAAALYLVAPDGRLDRAAAAVLDPARGAAADELWARYGADPRAFGPVHDVLRTRRPSLAVAAAGTIDDSTVVDARHAELLRAVGLRSRLIVPLVARGQVLGALSLGYCDSDRRHDEEDVVLAQELAGRVALALDNARLYSELHAAKQRAELSEGRYRTLVRNFPNGTVFLFDAELRYLIAGGAGLAEVSMRPEQLEGRTVAECLPPDLAAIAEPLYRAVIDGSAPPEIEQTYGGRYYRTLPITLRDEGGTSGMLISQDITAAKEAEIALRDLNGSLERRVAERTAQLQHANHHLAELSAQVARSRNLLQALFDGLPDALLLLDHQGVVQAANQALAALLALPAEQLLHQEWPRVCAAVCPPMPAEWVVESLHDIGSRQRRVRHALDGASIRVLDVRTIPLPASGGSPPQLIVHVLDSTERLQLEAIATQSERYIASATLAAMVAHEINTPLQAVKNFLFLLDDENAAEREHLAELAHDELSRIGAIVAQLLDLYRPMTGEPAAVDVGELVERVRLLTRITCQRQRVQVAVQLAPRLPVVWGRADQLVQLLLNLVVNALEAMPGGGILTIAAAVGASPAGPALTLTVSDTGAGIAAAAYPSIFDPFFTTKPNGTGLGLAICRTITAEHGGWVVAHPPDGGGAAFEVTLPLREPPSW